MENAEALLIPDRVRDSSMSLSAAKRTSLSQIFQSAVLGPSVWVDCNSLCWVLFTVGIPHPRLWDVLVLGFISTVISVSCVLCLFFPEPLSATMMFDFLDWSSDYLVGFCFLLLPVSWSPCLTFQGIPSTLSFILSACFTLLSCVSFQKHFWFSACIFFNKHILLSRGIRLFSSH